MNTNKAIRLRENLVTARESLGISQAELATHLNLDNTAVSKFEQGKRAISSAELVAIAEFYGKPLSWFFEENPSQAVNFRGDEVTGKAVRRDLHWLGEFADAYAYLAEQLAKS